MTTHSVDDLLVKSMQNQQAPVQSIPDPVQPPPQQETQSEKETEVPRGTENDPVQPPPQQETQSESTKSEEIGTKDEESKPNSATKIDEYGNIIAPPRTYTEDEVNRMIRDRLSRGRQTDQPQPTQQQAQKVAEDFKADPNSDDTWEIQLNNFIDKRLETRQAQVREQEWKQQESQKQAEFEGKFNTGMSKYQDFDNVVGKIAPSLTPSMMLATRSLENPAAFLYAAAKLHSSELERICKINDGPSQAMEVGRLHERMVKQRGVVSAAPKPIEPVKGDLPNKQINPERSLDQRIFDYAKQKRR